MFSFRQAFAVISLSIAFHLVTIMAAPIPVPEEDNSGGNAGLAIPTYGRKINGKDVSLVALSGFHQVPFSSTYSLVGGWEGKAAIVRIWLKTQDTKLLDAVETSVGFLKDPAVDLLYHSEKNTLKDSDPKEYEYIIVTKDMRKNYPKDGAPELARLYEWFDKDKEMDLADATEKVRNAAIKKAEEMAKEHKIVFRGIAARTVWTNKERDVVYLDTYTDAVRIKGDLDSDEAKKALEEMRKNAEENYTEANIRQALQPLS